MTQLVPKVFLRRLKIGIGALLVLVSVLTVAVVALALLVSRLQNQVDELASTADRARTSAERTERVLNDTITAVQAGSPQAAYTRAQIDALCRAELGDGCPPAPPELTATTVGGDR